MPKYVPDWIFLIADPFVFPVAGMLFRAMFVLVYLYSACFLEVVFHSEGECGTIRHRF